MAPAMIVSQTDAARIEAVAPQVTAVVRPARSARRMQLTLGFTPASARLFHAWRP